MESSMPTDEIEIRLANGDVNLCLTGRIPAGIQPVFRGASLCALN
jgi:hypothetical protein